MIRVVSYNVGGLLDAAAVVSVLTALAPDVVCMQEAPGRLALRRVARRADLDVVLRAGRGAAATAILVGERTRVLSHSRPPLTTPPEVPNRELAHAIVGVGGLRLSVVSCQLGLRPEIRVTNGDELAAFVAGVGAPSVIGCDLNESSRGPVAGSLRTHLLDAFAIAGEGPGETYPTPDASSRQDFVFADPQLAIGRCVVFREPPVEVASHHLPVLAEVALAEIEPDQTTLGEGAAEEEPAA